MIPASVTDIGAAPFQGCISLTEISVDPANSAFVSLAVFYSTATRTTLIELPAGNPAISYAIPESVTNVATRHSMAAPA